MRKKTINPLEFSLIILVILFVVLSFVIDNRFARLELRVESLEERVMVK